MSSNWYRSGKLKYIPFWLIGIFVFLGLPRGASSQVVTYEPLHSFGSNPSLPEAPLVEASDGYLYGTTRSGGDGGRGTIFRLDKVSGIVTTLFSFSGIDGSYPRAGLLQTPDGLLYWTTSAGGASDGGTIFIHLAAPTGRLSLQD